MNKIKLTEPLLKKITKVAMELDYESYIAYPHHHFSPSFRKKMKRVRNDQPVVLNELCTYNRRFSGKSAIVLIAVFVLVMGMTAFAVSPFVEELGNLMFTGHPGYMEIEVTDRDASKEEFVAYLPTKLPEGYKLCEEESTQSDLTVSLAYRYREQKLNYFQVKKNTFTLIGFSKKNVDYKIVTVIGEKGFYITAKKENSLIVEKGDYIFSVSGMFSLQELVTILESIKKVEQ